MITIVSGSQKMTDFSGFSTASKQALAAKDAELRAMQVQMAEQRWLRSSTPWIQAPPAPAPVREDVAVVAVAVLVVLIIPLPGKGTT